MNRGTWNDGMLDRSDDGLSIVQRSIFPLKSLPHPSSCAPRRCGPAVPAVHGAALPNGMTLLLIEKPRADATLL